MSAYKLWTKVPNGSRLEVSLDSEDEEFVGGARLVDDQGVEEPWTHEQLHPGPMPRKLSVPRVYTVRVRVAFTGKETATVEIKARIVKQDGANHGDPYSYTVSGKNEDIERATIVIATLKS